MWLRNTSIVVNTTLQNIISDGRQKDKKGSKNSRASALRVILLFSLKKDAKPSPKCLVTISQIAGSHVSEGCNPSNQCRYNLKTHEYC